MSIEREYLEGRGGYLGPVQLTPEQEKLRDGIKALEAEMIKRRRHYRYTDGENREYFERKMYELQLAYYQANQQILGDLQELDEKHKAEYLREQEKNVARDSLELERWKLRYGAMDKKALQAEADAYLNDDSPAWTPDRLEVLGAELARAGVKKIETAEHYGGDVLGSGPVTSKTWGEWLTERHAAEPWRKEHPETYKLMEFYDQPFGEFYCLEGNGQVAQLEILPAYMEAGNGKD